MKVNENIDILKSKFTFNFFDNCDILTNRHREGDLYYVAFLFTIFYYMRKNNVDKSSNISTNQHKLFNFLQKISIYRHNLLSK